MKRISFSLLLIAVIFIGCAKKIEKENFYYSTEQADLSKINPLAQFYINEDTLKMFESFAHYPQKKIEIKSKQKEEDVFPKVNYFVQVGLTDSYDEISRLKNQISLLFPGEAVEIKYDPPFYRVLVGPFDSKSKANEIFSILERKNYTSIRIRTETLK